MIKIDISKQARMLAMLRISDVVLIIICGYWWLLGCLAEVVEDQRLWQGEALIYYLLEVAILFFCVYTGFRHVGVIDARVWRAYMFAFPMLLLLCIINTASILFTDYANNCLESLKDNQTFTALFYFLFASVTAILGFVAVLLLQRTRIASLGIPLVEILNTLRNQRGLQTLSAISIKRVNMPLGVFFAACGVIIVFGSGFFRGLLGFGLLGR